MCPADPLIPPEATIRVYECDSCHLRREEPLGGHWYGDQKCPGTVTERVYVDLAAVDRDAWAAAIGAWRWPERYVGDLSEAEWRSVYAAVDDLLGPEDDRAH